MEIKKIVIPVLISLLIFQFAVAQDDKDIKPRKAFVSINTGLYFPSIDYFKEQYGYPAFKNGMDIAMPLTNKNIYLFLKANYYQKNGSGIIYTFSQDTNSYHLEGEAKIRQFNFHLGLQYGYNFNDLNSIIFAGGFSYYILNQTSNTPTFGKSESKIIGVGYFGSLGYERGFNSLPFKLFAVGQYNGKFQISGLFESDDFGGFGLNLGIRYYL
ncbi:MAG: hypothetical protein JXR41_12610 [Bacteroidales bacterium]|nr:hypothetical protein [Bacteroidales bacterium]